MNLGSTVGVVGFSSGNISVDTAILGVSGLRATDGAFHDRPGRSFDAGADDRVRPPQHCRSRRFEVWLQCLRSNRPAQCDRHSSHRYLTFAAAATAAGSSSPSMGNIGKAIQSLGKSATMMQSRNSIINYIALVDLGVVSPRPGLRSLALTAPPSQERPLSDNAPEDAVYLVSATDGEGELSGIG
jgi:hypothetical protein